MTTETRSEAGITTATGPRASLPPVLTAGQKSLIRRVILHHASTDDVVAVPAGMMKRMPAAPRS